MRNEHERYTQKMLRKLIAHKAGKRTKVTIPNWKADKEKNRQWITMSGMDFWGDPRARPTKEKD